MRHILTVTASTSTLLGTFLRPPYWNVVRRLLKHCAANPAIHNNRIDNNPFIPENNAKYCKVVCPIGQIATEVLFNHQLLWWTISWSKNWDSPYLDVVSVGHTHSVLGSWTSMASKRLSSQSRNWLGWRDANPVVHYPCKPLWNTAIWIWRMYFMWNDLLN